MLRLAEWIQQLWWRMRRVLGKKVKTPVTNPNLPSPEPGDTVFSVTLEGLSTDSLGTYGRINNEGAIGYTITPDRGTETVKWSSSPNSADAATYGTGSNPTDLTAADGNTVFLHVSDDHGGGEARVTRSFNVRRAPGTFSAIADQSFAQYTGDQTLVFAAATGTGLTWTYTLVNPPAGVTMNSGTRTITFATNTLAVQQDTEFTVRAMDQYGRVIDRVVGLTISGLNLVYTASVTSTDSINEESGATERRVSAPAHLASYAGIDGIAGFYSIDQYAVQAAPQVLYPGEVAMSPAYSGGTISLVHAPWAVGVGATSIGYRIFFGDTQVASALPYSTVQSAGSILRVLADVTSSAGVTTIEIAQFTVAENPLGPQLSGFAVNYETNTISLNSDIAATVTWRRYLPGHLFVNKAAEVLAGTGAIDGGTFAVALGPNSEPVTFTGGVSGQQEIWIVAQVGAGPISNVVGGPVNITPAGTSVAGPQIRGTSIGGDGSAGGVPTVSVPLAPHQAGDLVILPIGIDYPASGLAGVSATGPNGEIALSAFGDTSYAPHTIRTVSINPADYDNVINGQTYTATGDGQTLLRPHLVGTGSSVLIMNTLFDGANRLDINCIDLRATNNITIYNCEFRNCLGDSNAVRGSSTAGNSTDMVAIIDNTMTNIRGDGISQPQRALDGVYHTNWLIKGNVMDDCGYRGSAQHAIYCQGPDTVIVGNTITGRTGGNGISYRSSGLIAENTVIIDQTEDAFACGIKFYSDHRTGATKNLTIANNTITGVNGALRYGIEIKRDESGIYYFPPEEDWNPNVVRITGNTITGQTSTAVIFTTGNGAPAYATESWFTYSTAPVITTLTDNGVSGLGAISIGLLYYRATTAVSSGSVQVSILPGGAKEVDNIVCTPIIRYNVRPTGNPFAQVLKTFSSAATLTAQTASITATGAASRIEASILNDDLLPPGVAPTGWFMREFGQYGSMAMQTMSRNAITEDAGQVIAPVSVSLGTVAEPWVALTWELLPLET